MTARLDPASVLAYLESLHTDVRAAAVLGPGGELLAGDARLAARIGDGDLLAVEGDGHSLVVEPQGHAFRALLLADMRVALDALGRV